MVNTFKNNKIMQILSMIIGYFITF